MIKDIDSTKRIPFNLKEFIKGGKPCDLFEKINRQMEVARYKEIYSKEYLVPGLVTQEEYDTIPASTEYADWCRREQARANLMHRVVGAEGL